MSDSKTKSKWKAKWDSAWGKPSVSLSDTVIALNCTPYLQQTQTYKGETLKYYRFSVPNTYLEHGILSPDTKYKILIREIIQKKEHIKQPQEIQNKWKRKWVQNWEKYKYELGDTIHTLTETMTIAQTKNISGSDKKKVFWKFTIPRDYTKHGLIKPENKYRLLIREVLS